MVKKNVRRKSATKATPTTELDRKAIGKESVTKGHEFEERVAELYRLLGAEVTQNIMIHEKKVDILATFKIPASNSIHNVIVECKNEKRIVNALERVHAFSGLLELARKDRSADSAEIITSFPWSDQAKGAAKKAGITLSTFTQKVSQLIDFSSYLKKLSVDFDLKDLARPTEPPLGSYYVDTSAEILREGKVKEIPVINDFIFDWLEEGENPGQLAIFGGFGTGKSSLCKKLGRDLAVQYKKSPEDSRIPIILNLRDFIGKVEIESFITSFLDRECNVDNPRYQLFETMNEAGAFLLIFDGLDEMAVKVDKDVLESNLIEIEKLALPANSRVIITSRPEYFIDTDEERGAVNPITNLFRRRKVVYSTLKVLPWNDEKIDKFLALRVPLIEEVDQDWSYYRDKISKMGSLRDLSHRPVLLEMIVKTLPKLIKDDTPINLSSLYDTYLREELRRQKITKKRDFVLSNDDRLSVLSRIASDKNFFIIENINYNSVEPIVKEMLNPAGENIVNCTRDFLTNTFLIRSGDHFQFSHKSIQEYLVVQKLYEEISKDKPRYLLAHRLGNLQTSFIRELEIDKNTLLTWILLNKFRTNGSGTFLAGNAATLLNVFDQEALKGKDLSNTDLTGARLLGADLRGTKFNNANLRSVELANAKFDEKDLMGALFNRTHVVILVKQHDELASSGSYFESEEYRINKVKISENKVLSKYRPLLGYLVKEDMTEPIFDVAIHIQIPESGSIEKFRRELKKNVFNQTYVYADEIVEYRSKFSKSTVESQN